MADENQSTRRRIERMSASLRLHNEAQSTTALPDDLVGRFWRIRDLAEKIRHPGPPPYSANAKQKWLDATAALLIACDPGTIIALVDHITALTARLAKLERAPPEEVVEMAADAMERETVAINIERVEGHEMPRMYRVEKERMARAVISAIAPTLRAAERERCAKVCEEIAEAYELDNQSGDAAKECAGAIRAGGSCG